MKLRLTVMVLQFKTAGVTRYKIGTKVGFDYLKHSNNIGG